MNLPMPPDNRSGLDKAQVVRHSRLGFESRRVNPSYPGLIMFDKNMAVIVGPRQRRTEIVRPSVRACVCTVEGGCGCVSEKNIR